MQERAEMYIDDLIITKNVDTNIRHLSPMFAD